jgi:hypothetical protein
MLTIREIDGEPPVIEGIINTTAISPVYDSAEDAAFCENVIADNDRYNKVGITEDDISVVFEMGPLCDYGGATGTYGVRRFRAALDAMDRSKVRKVGERWFTASKAVKAGPVRLCQGPRCNVDISHTHGRTRFCSPRCQRMAAKAGGSE